MTSHNTDEIKGRLKEAIGAVTGDDELKSDGKRDQKAASAKKAVDQAVDKAVDTAKHHTGLVSPPEPVQGVTSDPSDNTTLIHPRAG